MLPIKVLIVDDSIVFRELLVQNLGRDPAIQVVGTARDPFEARDAILALKPDVMTLDIELPRMNGIEFLRKLMPQYPLPVVVISSLSDKVFDAMNAGAVDFVAKPAVSSRKQLEDFVRNELLVKIKIASSARISNIKKSVMLNHANPERMSVNRGNLVVAIGASTGGTEATSAVVRQFGTDIPGIVCVQHMPPGFTQMYAKRLDDECQIRVKEAETGDRVLPGHMLIAPGGDRHMRLVKVGGSYQVEIKPGPRVNGHCPSVEVLFDSVAKAAGPDAVGIILTGMGGDGAKGLLAMRKAGARTIGQDESTCVVYGMPKVAYDLGAVEYQEKLTDIAQRTYALLNKM
ncbi:chemotaxis response regulator protein-glutamate methylesterase [uncultured Acetatifactor sp.]|uniref:protein-glutamate methylesterase/protein-glutamine glutaminase n=1 Tax=uncultured Acetatifactor sp. TaxID=1671927 RepID=UPI0025D1F3E2|nr:chemotaxis response regulator protein-glutamate methylesterase [uncultured Acetatifactor sp.]MCI9230529.1 chemotaxis response regulator protein-glutamate methylesterase [Lachnospiraceae bacterium]MCI9571735.1 chemotaxis response regulator protein-glutamate methylesterase [Lachnospiraceae bacterium]MCI9650469.1 chemotaxis response regulator protein-glutamate methylesterase [Lachnospiraceae bacterium]